MLSSSVIGTPSAFPVAPPKLERMSLRTIPLLVSTFGPLEPSPGYGPAVSSGISPLLVAVGPLLLSPLVAVGPLLLSPLVLSPHAARPIAAAPRPNARSRLRRS